MADKPLFSGTPIAESPAPLFSGTPIAESPEEEEETSTFSDIAQGVGAGLIGLPQGIAETGAAIIDSIADTNTSRAVTKGFESAKDFLGFTPETTAGKTAESITTFGAALIPVIGWVGRASSVARGAAILPSKSILKAGADTFGKSKAGKALLGSDNTFTARAKLAATTSLTAGAAEMIIAPDGTATLADSFDVLPDALETEVDSGLQGRDEAFRRLRNKLRMGVEGTAVGVGFEALFPALGVTTRAVSMIPGVPAAARTFSAGFDYLGGKLSGAFDGRVGKYFTSTGETPKNIFEDLRTIDNVTDQEAQTAANLFASFDREARKVVKGQKLFGRGKEGVQKAYDDLLSFLEGDVKALDDYGKNVVAAANKMRNQVDELTDRGIKELEDSVAAGTVNRDLADAAIKEMEHNRGSYLRRLYEGAFDPETVTMKDVAKKPAYKKAVDQIAKAMQKADPKLTTPDAVSNAKMEINKFFTKASLDERLDPEAAVKIMERAATTGKVGAASRPLYQLSEEMFKKRTKFMERAPALRELLNEVRDPKELYIRTVSDLSKFETSSKFFREFAQTERVSYDDAINFFNAGARPLVISGENVGKGAQKTLQDAGYIKLGDRKAIEGKGSGKTIFSGKFGDLTGEYVPTEIYNALTTPVRNTNIATELLAISLQAKGISQMGKTVLNPIGQMRNFLSGTFMVGANGNLPRNTELGEAFDAVFKKASALSDEESDRFFSMIGDLGLVDENLAVNEMQLLLREQYGKASAKSATNLNSLIEKTPGVRGLQKIYSDTDTFWKTVGFIGEKAKYGAAFRKAGLDPDNLGDISSDLVQSGLAPRTSELTGRHGFLNVFASDIVKETMPIYSRVPEVIKSIRKIPVAGNFVAFPAEVIRNTANIVQRGTRELGFKASDELIQKVGEQNARRLEREIRAIGANRLTSYIASAGVIPAAVAKASYAATGVSEEDVEAMKPLMPYFMEGHLVMSLGKPKDGKWEHADLSYMMPYDFAFTPARRAMEIYKQKGEIGAGEAEQITASMWGAFASFMDPFAGESLIAERVQDALPQNYFGRGGETATGSPIWQDSNDFGTKLGNSFTHILGGFTPTFLELFVKPTARGLEAGRVSSAATGDPTRTGREYNIHEEAFTAATGMRKLELNIPKSLSFKGYEFTSLRSQSLGDFTRVAKANNSSEEDVINAYVAANEDAFRAQRQMYGFMKAAEAAGLSRAQIFTALKRDSNLGSQELAFIMSGKFRPVTISDKVVRDVYAETAIKGEPRKITKLPMRALLDKSREYSGKSLLSESLTEENKPLFSGEPVSQEPKAPLFSGQPVSQAPTIAPTQQVAAAGAPPSVAQAGVAPLGGSRTLSAANNSQLQQQLAGGGNPVAALKNLQATGNV
jgi:uncharacterized protein YukE|tara:strand:- start:1424 stop:5578 length:4155 start_codon:yes stop_codon:yes gene_type:complete